MLTSPINVKGFQAGLAVTLREFQPGLNHLEASKTYVHLLELFVF